MTLLALPGTGMYYGYAMFLLLPRHE